MKIKLSFICLFTSILLSGFSLFATSKITNLIKISDSIQSLNDSFLIEQKEKFNKSDSIIQTAITFLGVRYKYGSTGPKTFDCSGFTSYVYKTENVDINRTSYQQYKQGIIIDSICNLQKGDLVFFGSRKLPKKVGHVGIVVEVKSDSNLFKFIHASNRGVVIEESTTPYYKKRYLGARRILY